MTEMQSNQLSLGISPEEFEQYQRQFIEERSEKYALLEKVRKLEQDIARLSTEKTGEKDLDKLIKDKFQKPFQTLLSRTKRESESTDLIIQQENDALQKRLHSQEDDFQRQNVLLMQELQLLAVKNEELERKLHSPVLQNSLDTAKREELEAKIRALEAELSVSRTLSDSDDNGKVSTGSDRLMADLAAATEEIRVLKALTESNRKSYEATVADQERTVANLIRDLEGKQSSVQLLLAERDQLQRTNKDLISASVAEREKLISSARVEKSKLAEENHELRQAVEDERVMSKTRAEDIERQMKDLLEQMDVTSQQTKRDSDELLMEHKHQIASLLQEVETLTGRNAALEQSESEFRELATTLQEERTRLAIEETEMSRLAEKRKATIDDLTTHINSLKDQYETEKTDFERKSRETVTSLKEQLKAATTESAKVQPLEADLKTVRDRLSETVGGNEAFRKELMEKSSLVEELKSAHCVQFSAIEQKLEATLLESGRIQTELLQKLTLTTAERDEMVEKLNGTIQDLQQQLVDSGEEIKIVERKTAGAARDLQKQLQSEKKHVEKLQSKLNELLRDGTLRSKVPDDAGDFTERDETGSVSSWSFVSSKGASKKSTTQPDTISSHSNTGTETGTQPSVTEQEARDLVTRITKLQQDKATLMERVSMLETGNAAMAQDLIYKSTVIDRYLQTAPVLGHHGQLSSKEADAFSLRSLIDRLGRDKTMDVETQKNLRHLLEETLTKNVHLQKNMELLTEELDRLRGSTPPRQ